MSEATGMKFTQAVRIPFPIIVIILLVALLLAVFPQIDLTVSSYFYDAASQNFPWRDDRVASVLTDYAYATIIPVFFLAFCVLATLYTYFLKRRYFVPVLRLAGYFILLFMVVPLIVVSTGFKEHWGRARPEAIVEFGGDKQFTPYYQSSQQCVRDCSFSSGHSARAFYFMSIYFAALALGISGWRKHALFLTLLAYGVVGMSLRIMEGKHFLSDVLASAVFVLYAAWVLCRWMEVEKAKEDLTPQ